MRFGYAIRIGGDPEISRALRDGMEKGSPYGPAGCLPAHRGETLGKPGAVSDTARRLAMMRHTPEEWAAMTVKARYDYGQRRPPSRLTRGWWAAVGLIVYLLAVAYRAQDNVLGGQPVSVGALPPSRGR